MSLPTPDVARGPLQETVLDAPCPVCGHTPLRVRSLPLELPYFGEALQTTVLCNVCAYRHGDLLLTRSAEPIRVTLHVDRPEHLSARVARSSSGTVRVPELGAAMEPGPRAEAFVSNVEGVMRKFLDVVQGQEAVAEGAAARRRLRAVHQRIEDMIEGREAFTFVLEDPTGNSAVLHPDAVRVRLSRQEASRLKSAEFVIDLAGRKDPEEEE